MSAGSTRARATASWTTWAASSLGGMSLRLPPYRAMAVRTPLSTTTSRVLFIMTFPVSLLRACSHIDAAVDVELLAGDVVRVGHQEEDRLRDLFGLAEPRHRDARLQRRLDVGGHLREHVGQREARR